MDKGQRRRWENVKDVMAVTGVGLLGRSGGSGRDEKRLDPGCILQVQST